jgi:hypothetical protein
LQTHFLIFELSSCTFMLHLILSLSPLLWILDCVSVEVAFVNYSCFYLLSAISRKDTYGVFSEPVDSSLVCSLPPPHAVLILVPTLFCFWACFIMQVIWSQ